MIDGLAVDGEEVFRWKEVRRHRRGNLTMFSLAKTGEFASGCAR